MLVSLDEMNQEFTGLIIGYGSIGRRHARAMAELTTTLAIVNRRESVRIQAMSDHPDARVVNRVESLDEANFPWTSTVAVIATWGSSHAEFFHCLADRGVRLFLCEKPMASSVALAHGMVGRAKRDGIRLGVNHCLRYSRIVPALRHFAEEHGLGEPVAVAVDGGAGCVVTNGIHWVDFATELFGSDPERVISMLGGEPINPRSPDLRYYGGSAVWEFGGGRAAMISFNNGSSIEPVARVYFRNAVAELAYVDLGTDVFINAIVRRREPVAVERFPAVTRTGPAVETLFSGRLPGVRLFKEGIRAAIQDVMEQGALLVPGGTGATAVSSCVGALIAARERRTVELPILPDSPWGQETWPIS